jgi:ParB family transcriptional regulator, chromosome partitioning protein
MARNDQGLRPGHHQDHEEKLIMTAKLVTKFGYVRRDRLHPHPRNRPDGSGYTDLEELALTLKTLGCLQSLTVRRHPKLAGHYVIEDGWRRWAASEGILDELPVQLRGELPVSTAAALPLVAVTTSVHKVSLGPVEMAVALGDLLKELGSQAEICRVTGMNPGVVSRHLKLLRADEGTLAAVRAGQLRVGAVRIAIDETSGRGRGPRAGTRRRAPSHFNGTHPLAAAAAQRCSAAGHEAWTRLGRTACGPCWEATIVDNALNKGGRPGVVTPLPAVRAAS